MNSTVFICKRNFSGFAAKIVIPIYEEIGKQILEEPVQYHVWFVVVFGAPPLHPPPARLPTKYIITENITDIF